MTRRTDAQIQAVRALHEATDTAARAIKARLQLDDTPICVQAASYWSVKAEYQQDRATDFVVSFLSKDAALVERVAAAMKAALEPR